MIGRTQKGKLKDPGLRKSSYPVAYPLPISDFGLQNYHKERSGLTYNSQHARVMAIRRASFHKEWELRHAISQHSQAERHYPKEFVSKFPKPEEE